MIQIPVNLHTTKSCYLQRGQYKALSIFLLFFSIGKPCKLLKYNNKKKISDVPKNTE